MTTEYVKCLEYFCATKLNCYVEDLEELPKIYSKLAESTNFKVDKDTKDLSETLYWLYESIADCVAENLSEVCEDKKVIEYVDPETDNVKAYKVDGDLADDLTKIAEEIAKAEPSTNDIEEGVKFNSVLDKTVVP